MSISACLCLYLCKTSEVTKSAMAKRYDVLLRLLLVGDTGVGKTCLICRYAQDDFNQNHITTIGNISRLLQHLTL